MSSTRFAPRTDADVRRLIDAQPLAWVVSPGAGPAAATLLPLRIEQQFDDRIATLTGHFARSNPHAARLQAEPHATVLFTGPHAYVSPSWLSDRTQAPTWNYACANLDVEVAFLDTQEDLDRIVRDLVDAMERERHNAWSVDEMQARYAQLLQRIVPFRATVRAVQAKFKLGQDERDGDYAQILQGLAQGGNDEVIALMQDFNSHRLATKDQA